MIGDKKHNCKNCKYYIKSEKHIVCYRGALPIKVRDGLCYRFPKKEEVVKAYFCGEWRKK